MTQSEAKEFQAIVWKYYDNHGRTMPWRANTRPYYILVSELMLQQTQVSRVLPKFEHFIATFPDVQALACAPLAAVLSSWIGLGYNRRARFLHAAAQRIVEVYGGVLPTDREQLESLPGVGVNTAGAILTYAYNQPVLFVETNVRTVYLHHFFAEAEAVDDKDILQLLDQTMDKKRPREWYWALMDYGTHLKAVHGNNIARSKQYKKQSTFKGSARQMRGEIIRRLHERSQTATELETGLNDPRVLPALESLKRDGLVQETKDLFHLTGAEMTSLTGKEL